ncbi:unnamed protein product [Blepharisma stoltei]|uniref:Uncharacterized protein n=1 Tax=Blepharisma stoltei TaxID=1481888 RepID=A0AAU9K5M5_9CILI|nr:unnamed protein product [Blepharisma stoltei]
MSLRSSSEYGNKDRFFESKYKVDKLSRQNSNDRLSDFKQKLELSFKSQKSSQSNWKAFRSEVKTKPATSTSTIPNFSLYQDLSHFRPTTPTSPKTRSPFSRIKPQIDQFFKKPMTSRSPSPSILSPRVRSPRLNLYENQRKLQDVLKIEDLRKGIEILDEMADQDIKGLPLSYSKELTRFCSQALSKVRGFDF